METTLERGVLENVREELVSIKSIKEIYLDLMDKKTHPEFPYALIEVLKMEMGRAATDAPNSFLTLVAMTITEVGKDYSVLVHDDTDKVRPADIYRRWMPVLRWMQRQTKWADEELTRIGKQIHRDSDDLHTQEVCKRVIQLLSPTKMLRDTFIRNIQLHQTLPYDELDNPEWLDSYTHELTEWDPVRVRVSLQLEDEGAESFCDEDELDELEGVYDHSRDLPDSNADEYAPTPDLPDYRREMEEEITACRTFINQKSETTREAIARRFASIEFPTLSEADGMDAAYRILWWPNWWPKRVQSTLSTAAVEEISKDWWMSNCADEDEMGFPVYNKSRPKMILKDYRSELMETVSEAFHQSAPAKQFLKKLNDRSWEWPVQDVFVLFLSLQNGFAFSEEDMEDIHAPTFGNLKAFSDLFGDDVIEMLNSSVPHSEQGTVELVERFTERFLEELEEVFSRDERAKSNPKPTDTAAYNIGYILAVMNAKSLWKNGMNVAKDAGWSSYRESISHEGALAYKQAIQKGKSVPEAMKAFWTVVNKPRIVKVDAFGLTLSSGRVINWNIAILKLKNHEIDLDREGEMKLLGILQKHNWGASMQSFLQATPAV